MSEVEFYRDHIDGLRSQLMLRDRKIEQLEAAVTKAVRLFAAANKIHARLIAIEACVNAIDKSSISRELGWVISDFDAALSWGREGGEG